MRVRPYMLEDEPILREMHLGHAFTFPENLRDYMVVVDEVGCPIAAAGAKLVPEITLLCSKGSTHPLVKLRSIALLHEALRDKLGSKYTEAFAFVEPRYERGFGRHLQRLFHWRETWKCFAVKIGGR